jgi:oligopeptide transport system permease protein
LLRYALLRLLGAIPTLLLVIALAFLMVHAAPGGPFDDERVLPAEVEANIDRYYHLDEPLPQQFLRYVTGLVRGDLGPSYRYRDLSVNDLIGSAFPLSIKLGAMAMLLAMLLGIGAGTLAALRQNSMLDRALMTLAMTGISIPVFVIAPDASATWTSRRGSARSSKSNSCASRRLQRSGAPAPNSIG